MGLQITKEEITQRIRDNIKMKAIMSGCDDAGYGKHREGSFGRKNMDAEYKLINDYWRVDINDISVESKKPLIPKVVKVFKRLVRKSTYWLFNPLFNKVTEHNSGVTRILNENSRQIDFLFATIEQINNQLNDQQKQKAELQQTIETLSQNIIQFEVQLGHTNNLYRCALNEIANEIIDIKQDVNSFNDKINANHGFNYLAFEEQFRGSREDIKERQKQYLGTVLCAYRSIADGFVLDIGPGRGEFLELCRDNNIPARGVDINSDCVKKCQENGFVCENDDALNYLKSLEDNSLAAVTAFQVIEHLNSERIIDLIQTAYRKLKTGGAIILETVNPKSFASYRNFYLDLTHIRPVMPETLEYLLNAAGFNAVEIKFSGEIPKEHRLSEENEDMKKLNDIIFGYQDYAVVGRK